MNAQMPSLFTGLLDCDGKTLLLGSKIRKYDFIMLNRRCNDYMTGVIVFAYGSYRMHILEDFLKKEFPPKCVEESLKKNYTLLFDEILGMKRIELVE